MKETFLKVWLGIVSVLVILPFLFVAFFNYPSADDFVFAYKVKTMGFFQAQYDWYVHWTGRFFSTFILSLHPLIFNSNLLYKFYAIILILLTLHAIYRFVKLVFKNELTYIVLIFTCLLTGVYLNNMPILVQGIYWMPGAITYHLANILLLHFFINVTDQKNIKTSKFLVINGFLILAICGSNETSLLVIFVLLSLIIFFYLGFSKQVSRVLNFYLIITLLGGIIIAVAPGNFIRNSNYNELNFFQIYETILESIATGFHLSVSWIFSIEILFISILIIIIKIQNVNEHKEVNTKEFFKVLCVLISLFLVISASIFLSIWYGGEILPRSLNVSYWVFLIGWIYLISLISEFINYRLSSRKYKLTVILLSLVIIPILFFSNNNYNLTVNDIFSSKIYTYHKEMKVRESLIKQSPLKRITITSLSSYPNSIFYLEPSINSEDYFNKKMAFFYKKHTIKFDFIPSKLNATYLYSMDNEASFSLDNSYTITDEIAHSSPNSCELSQSQPYSVIFEEKVYKINTDNFKAAYVSANIYSIDKKIDLAFVMVVENRKKELIKWKGNEIIKNDYEVNEWVKEETFFYLDDKLLLKKYNKIKIYIWNRGKSKVYVDDLVISFF